MQTSEYKWLHFTSELSSCRDLGVLVSSDLSPSVHIDSIVAKAHQGANVILRCVLSRDVALLTI